jgi:flagellar hook-length control protein FliK
MTSPSLTDLSFNVWYEQGTREWCARVKELPMKLVAKAASPAEALVALNHHVNELLAHLDPRQPEFSTITGLDWEVAMQRAKVTPNEIHESIRNRSLSALKDDGESVAKRVLEKMEDTGNVFTSTPGERAWFVLGFQKGVEVSLGTDL